MKLPTGRRWTTLLAVGLPSAGLAIYLAVSAATFRLGFPLDDAWIHHVYARNLVEHGEWSFVPGQVSGGSTAPLWTGLLAVGHAFGLGPLLWSHLLGLASLVAATVVAVGWIERQGFTAPGWGVALAVTLGLEWHLLWAAGSGMEVVLVVLLTVILMAFEASERPMLAGLLAGLAIWIRPDAVSLVLIPAAAVGLRRGAGISRRAGDLGRVALGAALPLLPYIAFNLATAGEVWPSTLFAKQAEYAVLREAPLWVRLGRVSTPPLIGPGMMLLPGAAVATVVWLRRGEWHRLAPLLWAGAYLLAFALRLPATYQHGRYQIPVIPVLVLVGWRGIAAVGGEVRRRRLLVAWAGAVIGLTLGFVALGARAYARDVAVIESEMVETARWIAGGTEAGSLVAAHDIGALGYFGGRPVLDLAGLAEAAVIPILRHEPALAAFLDARRADYLLTFPGWYPELSACGRLVYASGGLFSPGQGGENLHLYRWDPAGAGRPETCMLYSP